MAPKILSVLLVLLGCVAAAPTCILAQQPKPDRVFEQTVLPILKSHCIGCHGPQEQNADVRLDRLSRDLVKDRSGSDTWHDALNALHRGEMPPEDAEPLTVQQRKTLVEWITDQLKRADEAKNSSGGQVVLRRLNRVEYQNTMRDLIGLDLNYARHLPPDPISKDGFTNHGASLRMSAMQLEYYLQSARDALQRAIVEGPQPNVHQHQADETVADKGKGNWSERLGRTGQFVARVAEFPDEGEFVIRVRARGETPAGSPFPIMQITLGFRADVSAPSRVVGTVDVTSEESTEFVFRGRLEEFPIQTRTQSKYPGMLIWIRNVYSDGQPPPKPKQVQEEIPGKKKKRKTTVYVEDPDFPKIVIESIKFEAPVFAQWPPAHHTRIIARSPTDSNDQRAVARQSITRFVSRAFRRPVKKNEIERFLDYYDAVRPTTESFETAMREVLAMVLVSPEFLYLSEPQGDGRPLSDAEFASRLSYFLWNTMPDQRLLELAAENRLSDPQVVRSEVQRMLADEKSLMFARQFSDQWLDLGGVDRIAVNPEFFPDFDNSIKEDMRREPQHYFAEVLRNNLSALTLLDSNFVVINQALAHHYGIDGPRGSRFQRVDLPPASVRGGVLAQAAVLLANSTGEDSHAIKRAVWIRDRLLGDPPPPPPPDVPDLNQDLPDLAALPLKLQLQQHRENESCAACHRQLDPWGVALEELDAVGLYRSVIRRQHPRRRGQFVEHPVDAIGDLPDGNRVDGVKQLKTYLVEHQRESFARALVEKLLAYATGRSLDFGDRQIIDELTAQFIQSDYKIQELIHAIVASQSFRQG